MEFIVEDDEKNYFDFIVLYDKDTFVIKFQDMPILFQKYDDEYYTKSVISNDYQHSIDFGIIKNATLSNIVFIEAKKTQLNLHDLGQLWAYCKLCSPAEAFLLSSAGLGSLNKIFNNLQRIDLLCYGDGKFIKKMHESIYI